MMQDEGRTTIAARDLKVVSALQCNGRMTMQALADKIGISVYAATESYKRLTDAGIMTIVPVFKSDDTTITASFDRIGAAMQRTHDRLPIKISVCGDAKRLTDAGIMVPVCNPRGLNLQGVRRTYRIQLKSMQ